MKEIVFLNGKFLSINEARIPVLEPGFLCGLGLFETMRAYRLKIVYFDAHIERIRRSCLLIGLDFPCTGQKLKNLIRKTVELNGFKDAYVRLTLYKGLKGTDTLIMVKKYKPYSFQQYKKGVSVCVSGARQGQDYFLAQIKSTNYLFYQLAYTKAREQGFDEALILNAGGCLCEGSRANLFFIKDKQIYTPSTACGCLPGITRKIIFDLAKSHGIDVYEGNFPLQELCTAHEAFLTNSLMGIMPLVSVGKERINKGKPGKITKFLQEKYAVLLRHGT